MTNQNNWEEEFNKEFLSDSVKLVNANGQEFMTLPNAKVKDILAFIHKVAADAERRGVEKCIEVLEGRIKFWEEANPSDGETRIASCGVSDGIQFIKNSLLNTPPND